MENDTLLEKVTEVDGCKVLGPCAIYSRLGQGGMGAVYRAHHMNLGIEVAVKCLKPTLADPQFVKRFKFEAKSAARIGHQNVVRVYDVAEDQGLHYIIMELVLGETARQRVERKGPLAVGEALEILHGAAQGLAEAHRKGIIHRDIKPDNILISASGEVKIVDLGLAKPSLRDDGQSMLSAPNQVMGTLQYMPPEQWESTSDVTMAADVWALGATFFFLVAGREAISSGSAPQIMNRIVNYPFPDLRAVRGDVPDEIIAMLTKATAKEMRNRFEDAEALATAVAQLETRRSGLRDKDAGTTSLRTLVSPPPQKTLDRIQTLLQVGPPRPGPRRETAPVPQPEPGPAPPPAPPAPPTPSAPTLPPVRAGSGRWIALAILVLTIGAGGAYAFVPGVREWLSGPAAPVDALAEAKRLEGQERYAEAITAAEDAHRKQKLEGKTERLGRLHKKYAVQLDVRDQKYLEALVQIGKSIDYLRGDVEEKQQSEEVQKQLIQKIAKSFDGPFTRGTVSPANGQFVFRGSLVNPLVKVKELRLGPSAVALKADGRFEEQRTLGPTRQVAVTVVLDSAEPLPEIPLRPWGPDLAFAEEIVAMKPIGSMAVTGSDTIELRGRLTDPEARLFLGGTELPMARQPDGSFTCNVPVPNQGENSVVVEARKSGQPTAASRLQVLRLSAPTVTVKASSVESAKCPIEVGADKWTKKVEVKIAGKTVPLRQNPDDKTRFSGEVDVAEGPNRVEITATNVVEQQTSRPEVLKRFPTLASVTLEVGTTAIPVKPGVPTYLPGRQAKVRVVTGAAGAKLAVNGTRIENQELGPGVDVDLDGLEEGEVVPVSFQVGFAEIGSKPFQAQLVLDTIKPVLIEPKSQPPSPQPAATAITVSGGWTDAGGCASITVDNVAASVEAAAGASRGTWSAKVKAPDKNRDLVIEMKDLAGNAQTARLPFEVTAAKPPVAPPPNVTPDQVFEPEGFQRKPGCRVENGYAEFLIHKATRIELVANDFGPGKKPGYYIAIQETTEQQWGGSGTKPKGNVTYLNVVEWLADPARRGLDLPTAPEWDRMPSQCKDGQKYTEWLKTTGGIEAPLRKESGGRQSYPQIKGLPGISFRVVYRVP